MVGFPHDLAGPAGGHLGKILDPRSSNLRPPLGDVSSPSLRGFGPCSLLASLAAARTAADGTPCGSLRPPSVASPRLTVFVKDDGARQAGFDAGSTAYSHD